MSRNSTSVGAFHPTLFLMVVYAIVFVLSFFIIRMVINSFNGDDTKLKNNFNTIETHTVLR